MKNQAITLLGLLAIVALAGSAQAITVGFEASEGYTVGGNDTTGNLASQPTSGTAWVNYDSPDPVRVNNAQSMRFR